MGEPARQLNESTRLASLWLLFPVSALFGLGMAIVTPSTTAPVADLVKAGRMGSAMALRFLVAVKDAGA